MSVDLISLTAVLTFVCVLRHEGQVAAYHFMSLNAYSKHKKLCNDYIRYYSGGKSLEEVCLFLLSPRCSYGTLANVYQI